MQTFERWNVKTFFFSSLLSLAGLFFPVELHSQDLGNVGLRTVAASLATAGTVCTGAPQTFSTSNTALNALGFRNLGQTSHQASALSTAGSFVMEIDGLDTNGNAARISSPVITFNNGAAVSYVAQGAGYYPNIQIVVTCTSSATFSLSYSGSFGSAGVITGTPSSTVFPGGTGTNVQGIIAQQTTGGPVFPVIIGGLQAPVNLGFTATGLDTFNSTVDGSTFSTFAGTLTAGFAPAPSAVNEVAFAFELSTGDNISSSVNAPWTCPLNQAQSCNGGGLNFFTATNVTNGLALKRTYQSANAVVQERSIIVDMAGTATAARQQKLTTSPVAFTSNTLAGSTIFVVTECNTSACIVGSVTDTQSNTFKQLAVANASIANDAISAGISLWMSQTLTTAAADTITATASTGTISNIQIIEVTGITTAPLTYLSVSQTVDPIGAELSRVDAVSGNQFVCNVAISTATTTQCQAAPTTINGVPVRLYITDQQINTTTAGAGSLLQLVTGTGANCATATANLSAITYSGAAVALQNLTGLRTPLIAPLQSAVCVKQTGATPSTSVVEVHGFLAP